MVVIAGLRRSFLLNLDNNRRLFHLVGVRRLLHRVDGRRLLVLGLRGLLGLIDNGWHLNFCRNHIACRWWPLIWSFSCGSGGLSRDGCCWSRVCWTGGLLHGHLLRWNLILNNNHSRGYVTCCRLWFWRLLRKIEFRTIGGPVASLWTRCSGSSFRILKTRLIQRRLIRISFFCRLGTISGCGTSPGIVSWLLGGSKRPKGVAKWFFGSLVVDSGGQLWSICLLGWLGRRKVQPWLIQWWFIVVADSPCCALFKLYCRQNYIFVGKFALLSRITRVTLYKDGW